MKKYKYARLYSSGSPARILSFFCTDPMFVEEIGSVLKKMLPQASLKPSQDLVDQPYHLNLEKIPTDVPITFRLITYMCQKGWEPFLVEDLWLYHFRFEYQE